LADTDARRVKTWARSLVSTSAPAPRQANTIVGTLGGAISTSDEIEVVLWRLSDAEEWPTGVEGSELIDRVKQAYGDLPPALRDDNTHLVRVHYRQVLRRRVGALHAEYLGELDHAADVYIHSGTSLPAVSSARTFSLWMGHTLTPAI
jgi:hypothetical protein